jgi:hypothetical protein
MKRTWTMATLAACALLAGCGKSDESSGSVTAEESRQLDNAAEMLDASPDGLAASEDTPLGNGEETAPVEAVAGQNGVESQ